MPPLAVDLDSTGEARQELEEVVKRHETYIMLVVTVKSKGAAYQSMSGNNPISISNTNQVRPYLPDVLALCFRVQLEHENHVSVGPYTL
jgi:hypothetical protein